MIGRRYVAGVSTSQDPAVAIGEAVGTVMQQLANSRVDLAVLFVSGTHVAEMADLVDVVRTVLGPSTLIAASAGGLVGGGEEIEGRAAVSLWAGRTGPVKSARLERLDVGTSSLVVGVPVDLLPGSTVLLLADPATFPVDGLIEQLPGGVALVGGLVSRPALPAGGADVRLWLDGSEYDDGGVAVVFPPGVAKPVVSQGCRPVGSPWVVTAADGNLIHELGGRPAHERLQEMIAALSSADRKAASRGLHIGLVANEQQENFEQGDFLIRSVMGVDRSSQGLAVGALAEVGQVVQFQVRDPASATAELKAVISEAETGGALAFTCSGRGSGFFEMDDHDAGIIADHVSGGVSGMFCSAELGPIGARNAVHGFTATVVTFSEVL